MCWISSASGVPLKFRASPRVCLDQFIGCPGSLNAPDWVNWDESFAEFFQPRGVIAETFVQLSMSRANQQMVRHFIIWHRIDDLIPTIAKPPRKHDRMGQGHNGEFLEGRLRWCRSHDVPGWPLACLPPGPDVFRVNVCRGYGE